MLLHVVSEYPEEEHVPRQVKQTTMKKHGRPDGHIVRRRPGPSPSETKRNRAEPADDSLSPSAEAISIRKTAILTARIPIVTTGTM